MMWVVVSVVLVVAGVVAAENVGSRSAVKVEGFLLVALVVLLWRQC